MLLSTFTLTKRLRIAVFLLVSLVLSACQHAPVSPSAIPTNEAKLDDLAKQHAQQLETIQTFKLESKIAIQHAGKGHSGRLLWQHATELDQLQLLSPFGQQVAVIERTAQQASLIDQQQRTHTAPNVETLTQELLGWSLPLTGLPYWAIGLPAPDTPAQTQYAPSGYLRELVQDGWQLSYDDYRPLTEAQADNQAVSNIVLPYSIDLQRLPSKSQGAEPGLKIRLRVLTWQVN
jgi:outer membrane lipoprotein LolB